MASSVTAVVSGGAASAAPSDRGSVKRPAVVHPDNGKVIKDSYIVVFKDGKAKAADVNADAKSLAKTYGGTVRRTYTEGLRGYAAKMTAAQAKLVAKHPDVAYVEQNRLVALNDTQQNTQAWGLDRIDQQWQPYDRSYTYPNVAGNVHAYVIDSGIRISHEQFGGRASYGINTVDDQEPTNANDCDGHGTHVAGTIGGRDYGVAKGAQLVAVRVFPCGPLGEVADIIAGVNWVTANAVKPAVANMSLGLGVGSASVALDQAVQNSINSGITYVVSAGNGDEFGLPLDACDQSPAHIPAAITVSGTDQADFRMSWANYGTCVDIFAPGNNVLSSVNDSDTATARYTGTSMSSPHVAGAAALLLSENPGWTPQQVHARIVGAATRAAVRNPGPGSTDRLLRIGSALPVTTGLRALANNKFVTTPSAGASPLIASGSVVNTWEQFDVVSNADGTISFKAKSNGNYVSAESGGTKPLIASRPAIGNWEKYELVNNADGTISLKALANGNYVSAESGGTKPLIASRPAIGNWEKFNWASPVSVISLRALANGKIVSAESGGTKPLIASRTAVGGWEQFDMIDLGGDAVAFRAKANNKYVTAEAAGAQPLIASRTAIAEWQSFWYYHLGDGSIGLQSQANFLLVTAEQAGAKPLIASRESFDTWQAFGYVY
ncbi:S8 family serine peptidase [Phytohabitans sp. LJ34]|uniref:S8 family serine peptidase n=1 Tax=Phytohabitans sp. LJ34 TaxID=3452217 RepID=UPI003F8B3659